MGLLFISHSSKDNELALKVRDWLEGQGWGRSQIFLDLENFRTGDRWRARLDQAGGECEAVIVCLSDEWVKSPECVREFVHAESRGKKIFPLLVRPLSVALPNFVAAVQFGDISTPAMETAGFEKLKAGLHGARIAPGYFPWPPRGEPNRAVYRGLKALEEQDAAIYFGRDADITRGLDALRQLRDAAGPRLMVILGASGAGKSSFLRAGLLARLRRDEGSFVALPVVRPERAALSGAQGLHAALSTVLSERVAPDSPEALADVLARIRAPVVARLKEYAQAAGEPEPQTPPTFIIAVDQAEELFAADQSERDAFCNLVRGAMDADGRVLLVLTIRSDSFEPLQTTPGFAGCTQHLFDLPPMPAGAFQEVIEGPAKLAQPPLRIEPQLTQLLLSDLDAADALPLLAFTLERLQSRHGGDGSLTVNDYVYKLGGLSGAIQSAVADALGAAPSRSDLDRARALFIPALVRVDAGGVKRRVARNSDLPNDARDLADRFVNQRLLVRDGETIEVAHEAILRQWPALAGWITEERGALAALDGVHVAAQDWQAHAKDRRRSGWLVHRGDRLKDAKRIAERPDFASLVDARMRDYLKACGREQNRSAWGRRVLIGLAGLLALVALAGGAAFYQQANRTAAAQRDLMATTAARAQVDRTLTQVVTSILNAPRERPAECRDTTAQINRDALLAGIGHVTQPLSSEQRTAVNEVVGAWERHYSGCPRAWLAYVLATAQHETVGTWRQMRETMASSDEQAVRRLMQREFTRRYAQRDPVTGQSYYGRGLLQVTWARNYRQLGQRLGLGDSLYLNPDLVLRNDVAAHILVYGLISGVFTRRPLSQFLTAEHQDWLNARRTVNGLDRAADIAANAERFYAILSDPEVLAREAP